MKVIQVGLTLAIKEQVQQDGWLEPAYFLPENKDFDQHLQTVKNETTV